ncbi:MAG TPA: hypothetical protein VN873_15495 [Candidatus Angelobacter sp.]|nr:hypothetical protein [Candidatus Angelobacter sp.]
MGALIKNRETQKFLKNLDPWTPERGEAKEFESSLEALKFCLQNKLEKVEVILKTDGVQYDLPLRQSPECKESSD